MSANKFSHRCGNVVRLNDKTNEFLEGNDRQLLVASSLISLIDKIIARGEAILAEKKTLSCLWRWSRSNGKVQRSRHSCREISPGEERTNRPARNKNSPAFSSDAKYPTGIDRAVDFQRKCKFPSILTALSQTVIGSSNFPPIRCFQAKRFRVFISGNTRGSRRPSDDIWYVCHVVSRSLYSYPHWSHGVRMSG